MVLAVVTPVAEAPFYLAIAELRLGLDTANRYCVSRAPRYGVPRAPGSDSTRCLLDIVARPICQDGARDNLKEMIGPWRECRLVDKPAERRHQGEQVVPMHIGARRSLGLSPEQ